MNYDEQMKTFMDFFCDLPSFQGKNAPVTLVPNSMKHLVSGICRRFLQVQVQIYRTQQVFKAENQLESISSSLPTY